MYIDVQLRDGGTLDDAAATGGMLDVKVTISEARRRLPELVKRVRKDAGSTIQISVRDEVVAELRAAVPEPEPGAAARALLALRARMPKGTGRRQNVSGHVKEHLYGRGGVIR